VKVRVFRYTSRLVRDSDGHTHPGDPHTAQQALLSIVADEGTEGHCLSPVEVVRPHLVNGLIRHVVTGQDPFARSAFGRTWRTGSVAAPVSSAIGHSPSWSWRCGTWPDAN
jgi:hypothetical protein